MIAQRFQRRKGAQGLFICSFPLGHEGARFLYVQRLSMARKSVIRLLAMDRDFYRPETQSTAVTRGFLNG